MSLPQVYITKIAKFLPNVPISNDDMELYLGEVNGKPSKSRRIVLRNNGINKRYYALNQNGNITHSNAEMTALAVKKLFKNKNEIQEVELLSCGTSTPDQMIPSHGVMVHGELDNCDSMEVVSTSGVCCSGMHALKYAYLSIKSGEINVAISTGSERISPLLKSTTYEAEIEITKKLEENPYISFEKDFLRWMLSDGAAACLFRNKPNVEGVSLRIDWLEGVSYAHELETCMYMGGEKQIDGTLKGYMNYSPQELLDESILSLKQDVKLLSSNIISKGFNQLKSIVDKRNFDVNEVDYFLPHMSSSFFKTQIYDQLAKNDMTIPYEKWFTNLNEVGNVGSASIYLMLEELFNSNKLKKGEKILIVVPESARFSYMFGLLTVC